MSLDAAEVRAGLDGSGLRPVDFVPYGPPPSMATIIEHCCARFSIDIAHQLLTNLLRRSSTVRVARSPVEVIPIAVEITAAPDKPPSAQAVDHALPSGVPPIIRCRTRDVGKPSAPSPAPAHSRHDRVGRSRRNERRQSFLEARDAYIATWPHLPNFNHQRQCIELFRQATTSPRVDFAVCGLCTEHKNYQDLEMWTVADVDKDIGRSEWQRLLSKTPAMPAAITTVYVVPEWNGLVLEPKGIHDHLPPTQQCSSCVNDDGRACTRTFRHPSTGSPAADSTSEASRLAQPVGNDTKDPNAMDERADDPTPQPDFHLPARRCPADPWINRWHSDARGSFINICSDCQGDLLHGKGPRVPLCSMANDMWIPSQEMIANLPVLSWAEEALICIYRLKLNVIRLKPIANIHQRGIVGTSSAFVHDVASVFATLPQPLSELDQCIRIMFMGKLADPDKDIVRKLVPPRCRSHLLAFDLDCRLFFLTWVRVSAVGVCHCSMQVCVRRDHLRQWLVWLIANNPDYRHVRIDELELARYPEATVEQPHPVPESVWEDTLPWTDEHGSTSVAPGGSSSATNASSDDGDRAEASSTDGKRSGVDVPIVMATTVPIVRVGSVDREGSNVSASRSEVAALGSLLGIPSTPDRAPRTETLGSGSRHVSGTQQPVTATNPPAAELMPADATHDQPYVKVRHTQEIVGDFFNPSFYSKCFPTLFPFGTGAPTLQQPGDPPALDRRIRAISYDRWVQHYLNSCHRRFGLHSSFMFYCFTSKMRRKAHLFTRLMVERDSFKQLATLINSLTTSETTEFIQQVGDGSVHRTAAVAIAAAAEAALHRPPITGINDGSSQSSSATDSKAGFETTTVTLPVFEHSLTFIKLCQLWKHVGQVGEKVAGSNARRTEMRNQIHSMYIVHGLPTMYITLNPSDMYAGLVFHYAGKSMTLPLGGHDLPPGLVGNGGYHERVRVIADDPVATAKFFHTFVTACLHHLIGANESGHEDVTDHIGGLFGRVDAYFGTVETQSPSITLTSFHFPCSQRLPVIQ
jgi:hypothetical protein